MIIPFRTVAFGLFHLWEGFRFYDNVQKDGSSIPCRSGFEAAEAVTTATRDFLVTLHYIARQSALLQRKKALAPLRNLYKQAWPDLWYRIKIVDVAKAKAYATKNAEPAR